MAFYPATLNTACRRSKRSAKKKYYPLPRLLLLRQHPSSGVWKNEKMVQGQEIMNKKKILPYWRWCHGVLLFLHRFMRFFLLLMLHHSDKIAIPHDHLFLILLILHLFLFKLDQLQGKLIISEDSRIVFWWDIIGNRRLLLLRSADLPYFWNGFVVIYFWPIFKHQFQKVVLFVLQQFGKYCFVIGGRSTQLRYWAVTLTS